MEHANHLRSVALGNQIQETSSQEKDLAVPLVKSEKDADAESLDLLIEELEEQDGKEKDPEILTICTGTGTVAGREGPNPSDTDPEHGLTDAEVLFARRRYGWNRLKEQKKRHIVKFLMLFVGPVQFVMEVG